MNQSEIVALKKRLADRHGEIEPAWMSVVGAIFWAIFCLLLIFIPL